MNKPNVIYILADDLGYGDVSALNENAAFTTPNFDSMCSEGICFTDAHASSAVCTPSRYSILTGRYNWRSRLKSEVTYGYSLPVIEKERKTVANLFKENGYRTAMIGKWHLGMVFGTKEGCKPIEDNDDFYDIDYTAKIQQSPVDKGFDYFYGISGSLDMPPYVYIENDRFTQNPTDTIQRNPGKGYWRSGPIANDFKHSDVLPNLTQRVLDKIEEYKDEPFFIYFPMPAPHTPILPSEEFIGKSGTNEYGDFVLMVDDVVGKINQKLKQTGLYDNTIVVFTSDNGCSPMADYPQLLEKGHNPSYIFRGTKADIYEGGHRIPLMITWPKEIKKGIKSENVVCLSDFMATMADILNVKLPDNMGEDSVSNLPIWKGQTEEVRESLVHQSIDGSLSIRKGKYKLEMCAGSGGWSWPKPGEETDDMPEFQLYDLEKDVREKVNVINDHPEVVDELKADLVKIVREGRSTQGAPQKNNGVQVWSTISWIEKE